MVAPPGAAVVEVAALVGEAVDVLTVLPTLEEVLDEAGVDAWEHDARKIAHTAANKDARPVARAGCRLRS